MFKSFACAMAVLFSTAALCQSPELRVIHAAAEALGGKDRLTAIKALKIEGYGQQAYQDGGGNPTGSPDAPQKWININGSARTIDLEHGRMHLEQRMVQDFVFAYARNMDGRVRVNQGLDGDVAFNVNADGKTVRAPEAVARARRIEYLNNPVALIRTAMRPETKLSNLHTEGAVEVMDITTTDGIQIKFAAHAISHLPAWMSWVAPNNNLGETTLTTYWVGYQMVDGVRLPIGYNTVMDWRNVVWNKMYIAKNTVDPAVGNLVAPDDVRAAKAPVRVPPDVTVTTIGKGVWYLHGAAGASTVIEFSDHLVMFEAYGSEMDALANIRTARTLVPAKPLTQVIVGHHHFDHTGGLRAAVSEGLTVITQRGNTGIFQEMTSRPTKVFPDALGKNMKGISIIPVDDKLVLKDATMEVDLYRAISNNHMPDGIIAYIPSVKAVAEGDMVDEGWDIVWWGDSYNATVTYWKLQVDRDLPVHGNIHTYPDALNLLRKQIKNAQDLCDHVEKSGLTMQGCPVTNTF